MKEFECFGQRMSNKTINFFVSIHDGLCGGVPHRRFVHGDGKKVILLAEAVFRGECGRRRSGGFLGRRNGSWGKLNVHGTLHGAAFWPKRPPGEMRGQCCSCRGIFP